jgi:hypothetical protein
MPMNLRSAAIMPPPPPPVHAELLEARWYPISSEEESHSETEANYSAPVNHSAPAASYESTHGVCNELARIALNRSAVMQAYDSMFPRSGALRATAHRSSPPQAQRSGWLQRALDRMFGPTPR